MQLLEPMGLSAVLIGLRAVLIGLRTVLLWLEPLTQVAATGMHGGTASCECTTAPP